VKITQALILHLRRENPRITQEPYMTIFQKTVGIAAALGASALTFAVTLV
jgi:hypothetical protein